jgi:large subunit ribosomal protein L30
MNDNSIIRIKLIRSPIGIRKSHRATLIGLNLKKLNSESVLEDTPSIRGMINKISYLLELS